MISAKEALEISKNSEEDIVKRQLQKVENCIKSAIVLGKFKINYYNPLAKNALDTIKKLGYEVEIKLAEFNEIYYVIKWENAE